MQRRKFNGMIIPAAMAASTPMRHDPAAAVQAESIHLRPNGWMPNNERLPVLVYRKAAAVDGLDGASEFERIFQHSGWPAQWRNGVYDFHHYHSTAHEVLGIASGQARLMLGGENGHEVVVQAGDVLLLPAGTGHCKMEADSTFLVVGAYPPDQQWDICRNAPTAEAAARMSHLPFPASDPVTGVPLPLTNFWKVDR